MGKKKRRKMIFTNAMKSFCNYAATESKTTKESTILQNLTSPNINQLMTERKADKSTGQKPSSRKMHIDHIGRKADLNKMTCYTRKATRTKALKTLVGDISGFMNPTENQTSITNISKTSLALRNKSQGFIDFQVICSNMSKFTDLTGNMLNSNSRETKCTASYQR